MILDHIENIVLMEGFAPLTNFQSIIHLKEGLFMTYESMIELEKEQRKNCHASLSFNGMPTQIDAQAINLMNWYSINLINYSKCCGLVKFLNDKKVLPEVLADDNDLKKQLRKVQTEYLNSIDELKAIKHYRNKVAAHLAYTVPWDDNPATLIESMSVIPVVLNGKFTLGGYTRKRGEHVSEFSKHTWNLTDNFKSLIPRYFKDNF